MMEFFRSLFESVTLAEYGEATLLTLKITVLGTLFSYILGLPLGVLLYGTAKGSLFPNKPVNAVLGFIVNVFRSVPFIILLVMTQPIAKAIVGTKIGNNAFIVYLVIAAIPFIARMTESSLSEVDHGVIEAAQSMGADNWRIITKVLIPEAKPSLLIGAAIALATILGYTPMTQLIAGGGLGGLALQYGLYRFQPEVMYISSILLIILVQVMQEMFSHLAKKSDKRIKK